MNGEVLNINFNTQELNEINDFVKEIIKEFFTNNEETQKFLENEAFKYARRKGGDKYLKLLGTDEVEELGSFTGGRNRMDLTMTKLITYGTWNYYYGGNTAEDI